MVLDKVFTVDAIYGVICENLVDYYIALEVWKQNKSVTVNRGKGKTFFGKLNSSQENNVVLYDFHPKKIRIIQEVLNNLYNDNAKFMVISYFYFW